MRGCRTSLTIGIWLINVTIGITMSGPTIGSCCNHASGGVWAMATTGASTAAAGVATVLRLLGTASVGWPRLGAEFTNSRRAAAANVHITGDSNGAVGPSPANGLKSGPTALFNAVVTTSTASCGCFEGGTSGCGTSIVTLPAGASAVDGAKSVTAVVSSADLVGAVAGA